MLFSFFRWCLKVPCNCNCCHRHTDTSHDRQVPSPGGSDTQHDPRTTYRQTHTTSHVAALPERQPRSRSHTQATQPPKRTHLLPAPHIQPHPAAVTQPDQHAAAVATVHQSTPDHNPEAERDPPGAPPAAAPGHVAPTSPTPPTLPSHEDLHVAHFRAVQGSSSAPAGCPHHAHPPFPLHAP